MKNFLKNSILLLAIMNFLFSPISTLLAQTNSKHKSTGKFLISGKVAKGWEIFVVNDDGSEQKKITSTNGKAINPRWSPDGTKFVYLVQDKLIVANQNGDLIEKIKPVVGAIQDFDWSPDGNEIVFNDYLKVNAKSSAKICVKNIKTKAIKCISNRKIWCGDVAWSPDGKKISFLENGKPWGEQAVVIDSNNGREIIKTHFENSVSDLLPKRGGGYFEAFLWRVKWTDDSKKIYFGWQGKDYQNYFFDISSGKLTKWGKEGDSQLFWSSKNNLAVYSNAYDLGIYTSNANGKNRNQLTPNGFNSTKPMLIASGEKIAFLCSQDKFNPDNADSIGNVSLYVMNVDGTSWKRVTNLILDDLQSPYSWCLIKK
jgi:Tol biopolymer transport system component